MTFMENSYTIISFTSVLSYLINSNPNSIKYIEENNKYLDEIISSFLSDPNPEINEELKKKLFDKMISEWSNLLWYLQILIENIPKLEVIPYIFLKYFNDEYTLHKDEFIEVLHNVFVLHPTINVFVLQPKHKPFNYSESLLNTEMISTLFEIVRVDSSNFQAYYCLECMANSFPFIFNFK